MRYKENRLLEWVQDKLDCGHKLSGILYSEKSALSSGVYFQVSRHSIISEDDKLIELGDLTLIKGDIINIEYHLSRMVIELESSKITFMVLRYQDNPRARKGSGLLLKNGKRFL